MESKKQTNPWFYIPSAFYMEGLPWAVVNLMANIIFVKMEVPMAQYTFWTALLGLPWLLKVLWAPLIEGNKTKRFWIVSTQYVLSVVFLLLALSLNAGNFFTISLLCFFAGALTSATHDIALDGYYMITLGERGQAFFLGVRTTFFRLAMLTVTGPLVIMAGKIEKAAGSIPLSWAIVLMAAAAFTAAVTTYHFFILPKPAEDKPRKVKTRLIYKDVFKSYFTQKDIIFILLFILIYPMSDALLGKLTVPFLLRAPETGALGVPTDTYGIIRGTFGMLASVGGGLAGGFLLAKFGFRKMIWPCAALVLLPNLFFAYLANNPQSVSLTFITFCVIFENLGDGVGFMAFTFFVLSTSKGDFKASFYAISSGIMTLGQMIPQMSSGKIFELLGGSYPKYFAVVSCISVLTLLLIPLTYKVKKILESDEDILLNKREAQ
jgi:PAT family beta-lactamase induction signal transducer AmpG